MPDLSFRGQLSILHIDHAAVLGGAERSVLELVAAQTARGYAVTLAVGGEGDLLQTAFERGVHAMSLDFPTAYVDAPEHAGLLRGVSAAAALLTASRRISAVVADLRPDVVHVHTRKAHLATAVMPRHVSPMLFHLRDAVPRRALLRYPIVLAVRRAAHAVALSPWMVADYAAARGVPRSGSIGVVPSGVDQRRLAMLRTPWLDGEAAPRIGYVGQIASWKGPHLMVELAETLRGWGDATFHLIGRVMFPESEQRYGDWLQRRIAASPARSRIIWHPATGTPEEAMNEIDVLVHTSLAPEPFGRVLVEAMASHRPIVAFRRGSTTHLLSTRTARLAAGDRVEDAAEALRMLLADQAAAREMALRAADAARAYEPGRVARMMEVEYGRVVR